MKFLLKIKINTEWMLIMKTIVWFNLFAEYFGEQGKIFEGHKFSIDRKFGQFLFIFMKLFRQPTCTLCKYALY